MFYESQISQEIRRGEKIPFKLINEVEKNRSHWTMCKMNIKVFLYLLFFSMFKYLIYNEEYKMRMRKYLIMRVKGQGTRHKTTKTENENENFVYKISESV